MPAAKTVPNGTAEAPIEVSSLPPLVGINFGNSFASIAVFVKDGVADCIANEDGERQIACAISFSGEEIYIGNQATQQLVKNSKNTITGFRNLLGKKFSEIPQSQATKSAPVIQHPDIPDTPAYKVQVLQPAPSPLPRSTLTSNVNTPLASHVATPRSEPIPVDRFLTVSEVTTMFIASLVKSAEDYLGRKVEGAVITVPSFFDSVQKEALEKAATDAGIHVLQLIDEAGAAAITTTSDLWQGSGDVQLHPDRTQLIVDVGSSSLTLSLLSIRSGLAFILASSTTPGIGGDQIDDKLIKFFASDFTKKTKTALSVCPSTDVQDQRAEAKLRLAIEHTKRTISASPGAATCSVESLKDGMDYTGSINRMRFDLVVRDVYNSIASAIADLLTAANLDPHFVDEVVYVGGSGSLPGLDEQICVGCGFTEEVETPFARGTVVGGGVGDPTTILARGCAIQAAIIAGIPDDEQGRELKAAYAHGGSDKNQVRATTRTISIIAPNSEVDDKDLGGVCIPIIHKETALPARRSMQFEVELAEDQKKLAFEVWELEESIRVEKVIPPKPEPVEGEEDEDEEEPEEEEVKHLDLKKLNYLGSLQAEAKLGIQIKGKTADAGKWTTTVQITIVVDPDGAVKASLKELGVDGASVEFSVNAP